MAASYPSAIKNFSAVVNGVTKLVASLFNNPYDEITALETELGTDPAGSCADVKTRLAVALGDDGYLKVGDAVDKSSSYGAQQATQNGIVYAYGGGGAATGWSFAGFSDSNADPTTRLRYATWGAGITNPDIYGGIEFLVKKGDYWKVVVTGCTPTVYFKPIDG